MSAKPTQPRMVVAVDGSASSTAAVRWAAHDAALRGLTISLLHADSSPIARLLSTESRHGTDEILEAAAAIVADIVGGSASAVAREVRTGHPVDVIVEQSKTADIVVVGFRGNGVLGQHLLGPVSEGVLHHAHCPVAVVRAQEKNPAAADAAVLVGVDGTATSDRAIALAFEEAQLRSVPLVAVHGCGDDPEDRSDASALLQSVLTPWQSRYPGVEVQPIVTTDRPAAELINRTESAQLVVVGSHGRGGFAGMLLGSVSSAVVRSVDIPVIVARS
ncbi:universal stress protein [soil metagenome]